MNPDEIAEQLSLFVSPTQFTELRCLNVGGPGRCFAGWFDGTHLRDLARAALGMHRQASGCYFIPNPIKPDVASKRLNAVLNVQKGFTLTHDEDVLERRFLIVDLDPRRDGPNQDRPTTARELASAAILARRYLKPYLAECGYAEPAVMCSGNGVHLVYRFTQPLPTSAWGRVADPVAAALADLSARFTTANVSVDHNTYNPCRMLKVPGTLSRKGEQSAQRPFRSARLLEVPHAWAS